MPTVDHEPVCPRCGQTGTDDICAACRRLEHEPQGETVQLFQPAPAVMPGQLAF